MSTIPPHFQVDISAAKAAFTYWESRWLYEAEICSSLPEKSSVVSVGEGTGEFMLVLARKFPSLNFTGFDLDPSRIKVANALAKELGTTNATFIAADACALDAADKSASFLYCRNTLHVFSDKLVAMQEIKRIARGMVYFSAIPNHPYAAMILRLMALRLARYRLPAYRDTVKKFLVTENYLRSTNSFHSGLWFLRLAKQVFPDTQLVGTHLGWTDLQKKTRFPIFGSHICLEANVKSRSKTLISKSELAEIIMAEMVVKRDCQSVKRIDVIDLDHEEEGSNWRLAIADYGEGTADTHPVAQALLSLQRRFRPQYDLF